MAQGRAETVEQRGQVVGGAVAARVGPQGSHDGVAADPVRVHRQEHQQLHHPRAQPPGHLDRHPVHRGPGDTHADHADIGPTVDLAEADVARRAKTGAGVGAGAGTGCGEHRGTPQDGQRPPCAARLIHSSAAVRGCRVASAATGRVTDRPGACRPNLDGRSSP